MIKSIFPVRFTIGAAAAEPLSSEFLSFYAWLASLCTESECQVTQSSELRTTPLTNEEVFSSPPLIYIRLLEAIKEKLDGIGVLLIDLSGPFQGQYRGSLEMHLGSAVVSILAANPHSPEKVIIWLPELPPPGEVLRGLVEGHIESGRLILLDRIGKVLARGNLGEILTNQDFSAKKAKLRLDPLELLRFKMIRRVGHFPRFSQDRHFACQRYFYDGRRCVGEIVDILTRYITTSYVESTSPVLVASSFRSPWLREAVLAVSEALGVTAFEAAEMDGLADLSLTNILLVFDIVDKGASIQRVFREIRDKLPKLSEQSIRCFSVLSTHGGTTSGSGNLKRFVGRLAIDFGILVDQHSWLSEKCPLCRDSVPLSDMDGEEFDMLTSYGAWELIKEAGLKKEQDVPPNRPSLGDVPDFPRIIKAHGAWIAYKMELSLESMDILGADPVFVCPDEYAPQLLADYLQLILKATVVKIPRFVIAEVHSPGFDFSQFREKWGAEGAFWYLQLETLSARGGVVIFDEFHASGGTFAALSELLRGFNVSISCYFPVVDFNPSQKLIDVSIVSLYSFQAT